MYLFYYFEAFIIFEMINICNTSYCKKNSRDFIINHMINL